MNEKLRAKEGRTPLSFEYARGHMGDRPLRVWLSFLDGDADDLLKPYPWEDTKEIHRAIDSEIERTVVLEEKYMKQLKGMSLSYKVLVTKFPDIALL